MLAVSCSTKVAGAPAVRSAGATTRFHSMPAPFLGRAAALKPAPRAARPSSAVITRAMFGMGTKAPAEGIYSFTATDIDGKQVPMSSYKGKVLLICNVASACGFTPQYKGLQALFGKYKSKGLEILAFPCNQFGSQEPGSNAEIKAFAQRQGAQFKMMGKVDVNGSNADPIWNYLKSKQGGLLTPDIKWNFSKMIVNRDGEVVKRYPSTTTPEEIEKDIAALI